MAVRSKRIFVSSLFYMSDSLRNTIVSQSNFRVFLKKKKNLRNFANGKEKTRGEGGRSGSGKRIESRNLKIIQTSFRNSLKAKNSIFVDLFNKLASHLPPLPFFFFKKKSALTAKQDCRVRHKGSALSENFIWVFSKFKKKKKKTNCSLFSFYSNSKFVFAFNKMISTRIRFDQAFLNDRAIIYSWKK